MSSQRVTFVGFRVRKWFSLNCTVQVCPFKGYLHTRTGLILRQGPGLPPCSHTWSFCCCQITAWLPGTTDRRPSAFCLEFPSCLLGKRPPHSAVPRAKALIETFSRQNASPLLGCHSTLFTLTVHNTHVVIISKWPFFVCFYLSFLLHCVLFKVQKSQEVVLFLFDSVALRLRAQIVEPHSLVGFCKTSSVISLSVLIHKMGKFNTYHIEL